MILGIESSCDESALAVFDPDHGLLADLVYSQIQTHQQYGGIVPDLASREHLDAFVPLLNQLKTQIDLNSLSKIAVTTGPGLASCLALGLSLARSLSLALEIPIVGVNHLRGHVFSPLIPLHRESPGKFQVLPSQNVTVNNPSKSIDRFHFKHLIAPYVFYNKTRTHPQI